MKWHNFKEEKPPRPEDLSQNALYLCEVSGIDFCRLIVLQYDHDGWWWIYVPRLAGLFDGGWLKFPDNAEILNWAFIEEE